MKPRIYHSRVGSYWICDGSRQQGYGGTAAEAYWNWMWRVEYER